LSAGLFYVWLIIISFGLISCGEQQREIDESLEQPSLEVIGIDQSSLQNKPERPEVHLLISETLRCEVKTLKQCAEWHKLFQQYASDLRQVVIDGPQTLDRPRSWLDQGAQLLTSTHINAQIIGVELLLIGARRLKYRIIPQRLQLSTQVQKLIASERDSLHQTRLLTLLHELTPLESGNLFRAFTDKDFSEEVQERAWQILALRHSPKEPVSLSHVKRAMRYTQSLVVKASIIRAASLLKTPLIVRWCGRKWWQTKLYQDCRDGLTLLGTKSATRLLWMWVDALFEETDQALNSDQMLASALSHLSYGTFTPRLKRRYIKLLDRFFSRRRTEESALLVAQSWLHLTPRRFAREVYLRYLKSKKANVASQSHLFKRQLRQFIHILDASKL
jgi:hypothetical protein